MVGMNALPVLFLSTILWCTSTGHKREGFYLTALWIAKIIYSVDGRWMKYKYVYEHWWNNTIRENQTNGMKTCPSITLFTYPTTKSLRSIPGPPRRQGLRLASSASENDYIYTKAKEKGPADVSSTRLSQALQLPLLCTLLYSFTHRKAILFKRMLVQITIWWLSHEMVKFCQRGLQGYVTGTERGAGAP